MLDSRSPYGNLATLERREGDSSHIAERDTGEGIARRYEDSDDLDAARPCFICMGFALVRI